MADKKISALTAATTPLAGTEVLPIVQGGQTRQVSVNNLTSGKTVSATQYTSTIATGTAPLVVASTTEVANLKAANATSADTANQIKSNATTGLLQVAGPGTGTTRVMTTPDANFSAARIDAAQSFTGNQTLATGNLVIGTSGKGIDFSATPGTGTSELLADYEEGTWTPVLNSFTGTASSVVGRYTKVGNLVKLFGYFIPTTTIASTVAVSNVTGLPFAPSLAGNIVSWSVDYVGQLNSINVASALYAPTVSATAGFYYFSVTYTA